LVEGPDAPEGAAGVVEPAEGFSLDAAVLKLLIEEREPELALDRIAADLKERVGDKSAVVIAMPGLASDGGVCMSYDGRAPARSYLSQIDFGDQPIADGVKFLRIDVAGAAPLAADGRGAPLLRAIAAGFKEACRAELAVDVGGSVAIFLHEPSEDQTRCAADLRQAAEILNVIGRIRQTVRRADDGDTRFQALTSTIPGVIYQRVVSPDGQIRYAYISENAFDLFGVTAQKILSDPEALFAHYGAEYRSTFRQKLIEASRDLTLWDVEATIQRPDGQVRYTHAIARPNRQADGSVVWTGVILDSTRIKEAELAATAAEARTREAIVESLSQGVLLFDKDDRLTLRNSHFLQLYPALAETAAIGAHYEDVLRFELGAGADHQIACGSSEEELADRLARHGEPHLVYEREMAGDRHILVNEYRTPDDGTVVLYTDISELKRRERKIEHLAHHDALTGLPNRVLFHERLEQAIGRANESDGKVAVICLDLDRFKAVNDTLGHHVGDLLLQDVANRIRSVLSERETACRLGGDEFAIICPNVKDPSEATSLAWRLLNTLAQPHSIHDQTVISGTSIGIAISGQDGSTPEVLLKNADLALYRAKADGRGTFRFFEQEMDLKAQARRMMELALRSAVARQELEVHYQPLVDSHTSQIMGAEALLRWKVPGQGYISPAQFVPLAEETGLISEIGRWVLRKACHDAAGWENDIRIAVNLSPAQLRSGDFVDYVKLVLAETGLPAQRLELEITEGMLLHNTETNTRMLMSLKQLGVRISMDDFGTGYSSLGYLRSFPFDKIKIDKSFIADLSKRPDAAAIIRAILTLGRSLGMTTTAEGVETRDQLAYLRAEGCMEVQGFYFATALTETKFREILSGQKNQSANVGAGVLVA
ncbi:MAG: putative bifunctional diguanylate cyclase/phosphodiesterase, partial [Beijerinckiaceae bacterium]